MAKQSLPDYRQFSTSGPVETDEDLVTSRHWWKEEGDDAARAVAALARVIHDNGGVRRTQLIASANAYQNQPLLGIYGWGIARGQTNNNTGFERVRYNVTQSATDTLVSRLGKNRPAPMYLTSGGSWDLRRKAKKLNAFVAGVFNALNVYLEGLFILRDACVWGVGITHGYMEDGELHHERVLPFELLIDEVEGTFGSPRTFIRVRQVDRHVAMARWPDAAKVIEETSRAVTETGSLNNTADMIDVYEAWHLPSGDPLKAKDGKHIVCINGHALTEMEDWKHSFPPFSFMVYSPRLIGFWASGLAESIQSIQVELNRLMRLKQWSFHKAATYKVLMEMGSKIDTEHINNDVGAIIKYQGTKPEWVVPPVLPKEFLAYEQELKMSALTQPGINEMTSQGQVDPRIKSGKGQRIADNLQSDRLQTIGRYYEQYFLDLARLDLALVRDAKKNYKVKVQHRTWLEIIEWKDIAINEDEYLVQCFPVSSLPNDPAGRLETITEFAAAGMYTLREAKRLFGFPDLEQIDTLQTASEEFLLKKLEQLMDGDESRYRLEVYDDLPLALELGRETYQLAKYHEADSQILESLRQWIDDAKALIASAQAEQQTAQAAAVAAGQIQAAQAARGPMSGPPQASPTAPPTSPLLPNAPT